jgi:tetratricopeptide (TPR) repeat protein
MPFDLFISYSRKDNKQGRISELTDEIKSEFQSFAGRPLLLFFDLYEIEGMSDWRHRILQGLRESSLLLVCLSPSYLQSDYCEWEFNEFLKHEFGRAYLSEGVAPIYFVEVPGWEDKGFENQCADWIKELRRRQHFDLRPWFYTGQESLRDTIVHERMKQLNTQIKLRLDHRILIENIPGNIDSHNPYFIGRTRELRRLREVLALGKVGMITAVHGLGGVGKTALAIEYAHAFADNYGGGRWQIRCEGKENIMCAVAELASALSIVFNEEELRDSFRQFQRVISELKRRTEANSPNRCLLILDNVDNPKILDPSQTKYLPRADWLHIIVTTRLGESDLFPAQNEKSFLAVDELHEDEAVELLQTYQPRGVFDSESEKEAAREIIKLLDCYTLAVEAAAVFLGQYAGEITCIGFLNRLRNEGLSGLEDAVSQSSEGLRHGEKKLTATLIPTLERLSEPEILTLGYAALLPPDNIALRWIRTLVSERFKEFEDDVRPGYPDPWKNILRHLFSLRLLQITNLSLWNEQIFIVKMHRLVQQVVMTRYQNDKTGPIENTLRLSGLIYDRSTFLASSTLNKTYIWELECLHNAIKRQLLTNRYLSQKTATYCCSALREYGKYLQCLELAEMLIFSLEHNIPESDVSVVWSHNMAGVAALYLDESNLAEYHFNTAKDLTNGQQTDDSDKLDTLTNIGCIYWKTLRPNQAVKPSEKALEISKVKFGIDSPEAGFRYVNLGLVFQDLCNLEKAISLFKKAIRIDLNHPELKLRTCQDLGTLAEALRNEGNLEDAEKNANCANNFLQHHGYEQHPIAINVKINLAAILEQQNRLFEARNLYESARDLAVKCFGDNSTHLSLCLNNLGVNSLLLGDLERSLKELLRSFQIEKSQKNPNNQRLAHRELNIGIAYLLVDNHSKSLSHLHSGWDYKTKARQHDLLSARLLQARIALSFELKEDYSLFLGQLNTLINNGKITASGINIRWTLESVIKNLIKRLSEEEFNLWDHYNELILEITGLKRIAKIDHLGIRQKRNLNERWPEIS